MEQHGLGQYLRPPSRSQHGLHVGEGEAVLGPSDSTTVSSSAAACSSKSNETQKRLRSASPSARLIATPEGRVNDELGSLAVVEAALDDDAARGSGR